MAAVPEYFGSMVFDDRVMKANLSAEVYQSLKRTIDQGEKLNIGVANAVAAAIKDWAVAHGATHFTHWSQPLTGVTAAPHDSHHRFLFRHCFAEKFRDGLHRTRPAYRTVERRNIVVFDQRFGHPAATGKSASAAIGPRQHRFDLVDPRVFVHFEFMRHEVEHHGRYQTQTYQNNDGPGVNQRSIHV